MVSTTPPTTAASTNPALANAPPTGAVPGPPQPNPTWPKIYHFFTHVIHAAVVGVLAAKMSSHDAKETTPMEIAACVADAASICYFAFMQAASPEDRIKHRSLFFVLGCLSNACLLASFGMNIHGIATFHKVGEGAGKQKALGWTMGALLFCLSLSNMYSGCRHHRAEWAGVVNWVVNGSTACAGFLVNATSNIIRGIDSAWDWVSSALGHCVSSLDSVVDSIVNHIRPRQPGEADSGHNA